MKHVRDLFESVEWTKLRPAPNMLSVQPGADDPTKFVASAATPDEKVMVFYAPAGGTVPVKPFLHKREVAIEWFNPRIGEKAAGDDKYKTPDAQDWLLVIRR